GHRVGELPRPPGPRADQEHADPSLPEARRGPGLPGGNGTGGGAVSGWRGGLLLAGLCALAASPLAPEAPPAPQISTAPELRSGTRTHTAPTPKRAADAAGRFLVTGSVDKTLRVWDLKTGALLTSLRPPIGMGNVGKVASVALSPDGRIVAAGEWGDI